MSQQNYSFWLTSAVRPLARWVRTTSLRAYQGPVHFYLGWRVMDNDTTIHRALRPRL